MYYLLEDNRIYKDSDYIKIEDEILYKKIERYSKQEIYWSYQGHVKSQSENVFEFIETGDLIKFKNKSILKVYTPPYCSSFDVMAYDVCLGVYTDEILAIYKPDKHGNYIKVWERGIENE